MRFAVEYAKAGVDSRHSDRLCKVALANAGIAEQQNVFLLFDKTAAGKFEDQPCMIGREMQQLPFFIAELRRQRHADTVVDQ